MKKAITAISILVLISSIYGCATSVADLKPIMPTGDVYASLDCKQLEQVCTEKTSDMRFFATRQEAKEAKDSTKMALNVLVLPVFWGVGDDENTAKLQDAMGCYQEASNKADLLKCDFKRLSIREILGLPQEQGSAETTPPTPR
jgi:hypothetical protein